MSAWSYINGMINVSPLGRSQEEIEYILKTIIRHLPKVTGSERDMHVHVIKSHGSNSWSNFDELGRPCDFEYQDNYIVVLEGNLRDRFFEQTKKEFIKWLSRLSKRVLVNSGVINVSGLSANSFEHKSMNISFSNHDDNPWHDMFEWPSWTSDSNGEPTWCEYLMWDSSESVDRMPIMLAYKYFYDEENDAEAQRRIEYKKRRRR